MRHATAEIEALCTERAFDKAVVACESVLSQTPEPHLEAEVRILAGKALALSSHPQPALAHLRRAKEILSARPHTLLQAECADWESACLYLMEDSTAVVAAEQALEFCRRLDEPAPLLEARILEHLGSIHVRNHAYDSALAYYERALATAGNVRDLRRLARIYHGLGAAYDGLGQIARATQFVRKAVTLCSLEGDPALIGRAENELGLLLMRQGQFLRAEELFVSALRRFRSSGTEVASSHVMLSLGELYANTGRLAEAVTVIRHAIVQAHRLGEVLAESNGHQLLGDVLEKLGRPQEADQHYRAGLEVLSAEGPPARLAEMHASYASLLERRSDIAAALNQLKQAAAVLGRRTEPTQSSSS